jgi:hypothetical protein
MKKFLALLSLLVASSSYACSFKTSDTPEIREIVRKNGGYPISDAHCNFINQRNLALSVDGHATVLAGVSVAWVNVTLAKLSTGIKADRTRHVTQVNTHVASQDTADGLLYDALRNAIEDLEYEIAANEISRYMAKNKK